MPWDRCPTSQHNLCNGDKGVGLLYNVVVSHERKVLSVSQGFAATINDKISVKYDQFIHKLKNNELGNNLSYTILVPNGQSGVSEVQLSSFYVIADGG